MTAIPFLLATTTSTVTVPLLQTLRVCACRGRAPLNRTNKSIPCRPHLFAGQLMWFLLPLDWRHCPSEGIGSPAKVLRYVGSRFPALLLLNRRQPLPYPATEELPVIRPRSMRSAEITPYKPVLNAPGVRFVIGFLPLTDGTRPSRDVKAIIARSADGRIQNYSRGGHHDSNQCYTTRQRAGRCNSSV